MCDKIGINIVGVQDHSTRLYNTGDGFRGVTGKIAFGAQDSLYLLITAERKYTVAVEGDLELTPEVTELSVTPYDVDWSTAARSRGCGSGKLFLTNPDAPGEISVFELVLDANQSVQVKFAPNGGINARVALGSDTDVEVLDPRMKALMLDVNARHWFGNQTRPDSSRVRAALSTGEGLEPFSGDLSRLRQSMLT